MKRKLKTWKQFEEEFKFDAEIWEVDPIGHVTIHHKKADWGVAPGMIKYFGSEIEVGKTNRFGTSDTYCGEGYYWNETAFEPNFDDFINEEEMMI